MAIKKFVTPENLNTAHFNLNQATKKIDVIFPPQTQLPTGIVTNFAVDTVGKQITFNVDGSPQTIDITSLVTDVHVSGGSLSGTVITLTRTDGQGDITIDLQDIINQAVAQITVPTTGTATLDVEVQDAFGEPLGFMNSAATVTSTLA